MSQPTLILHNGKITTQNPATPTATSIALQDGRVLKTGTDADILALKTASTTVIDLKGKRVIPGLVDSHLHVIRGGLNYNMELRWDGVPSLADAMRMLREQVARTLAPQWVRVVGGFSELQFAERRLPTPDELNAIAPDTPVFILHLYDRAILNRAALRAVGYDRNTPEPPGGIIQRDKAGNPTGLLIANPNAWILYKTLSLGPKLPPEYQLNSTRQFMRELNRLGVTSIIDAGGGFQNWPDDYSVILELQKQNQMTLRVAYNLFTQRPKQEREDFANWAANNRMYQGDEFLRLNGAGEMLVYSAADFEDFLVDRPDMSSTMEQELEGVVGLLARNQWSFRLHTTYDQTISRALDVFEKVHRDVPLTNLRWFFDHCETVSPRNLDRIKTLGGGIAIQHRMAFQGEYFRDRYGPEKTKTTPPIKQMLAAGIPVGAGTDATRVASYNPWTSLWWLVTGKTVGGLSMYDDSNKLSREEALQLFTQGSAYFSREEDRKGTLAPGYFADLIVLSDDFFTVPEDSIRHITSHLTIVDGKIVFAAGEFSSHAPPSIPVLPDWSPVARYGGHWVGNTSAHGDAPAKPRTHSHALGHDSLTCSHGPNGPAWGGGCSCWVF
jgi:predicted amidohydrolase YtcJ